MVHQYQKSSPDTGPFDNTSSNHLIALDGDGVLGMSNLVAIPMRGAAGDTALSRKRGWHEKMVDEHKRKASKGEQISMRNYLS